VREADIIDASFFCSGRSLIARAVLQRTKAEGGEPATRASYESVEARAHQRSRQNIGCLK
jgi:hypothetical protein